jgi:hypothetical protein
MAIIKNITQWKTTLIGVVFLVVLGYYIYSGGESVSVIGFLSLIVLSLFLAKDSLLKVLANLPKIINKVIEE